MNRPTPLQIEAAAAVIQHFATTYGGVAAESRIRNCAYSVCAALGGPGQPAEEYTEAIALMTGGVTKVTPMVQARNDGYEISENNPFGIPAGFYYRELTLDELPTAEELAKNYNKTELVEQINEETGGDPTITKDDGTTKELLADLLFFREKGTWPVKKSEEPT